MPLYEYECSACHRRTEKIQKFSDADLTVCPHCGGALERTITAAAISFKGSGWYKDLYSSPKPPASGDSAANTGSAEAAPAPAASSEGSSSAPPSDSSASSATPAAAPAAASPAPSTASPSTAKS